MKPEKILQPKWKNIEKAKTICDRCKGKNIKETFVTATHYECLDCGESWLIKCPDKDSPCMYL